MGANRFPNPSKILLVITLLLAGCSKQKEGDVSYPYPYYFNILRDGQPLPDSIFNGLRYYWYDNGVKEYYSPVGENYVLEDTSYGQYIFDYYDTDEQRNDQLKLFSIIVWSREYGADLPSTFYIEYPDLYTDTVAFAFSKRSVYPVGIMFDHQGAVPDSALMDKASIGYNIYTVTTAGK